MNDRVIWDAETCYGFLRDIVEMFKKLEPRDEAAKLVFDEAIKEGKRLLDIDDNYFFIYMCDYSYMSGYYIYTKLVPEE